MKIISRSRLLAWPHQTFRATGWGRDSKDVYERQQRLPGYSTAALQRARVGFFGAGGLTSFVLPALVRKGLAKALVADHDVVEISNLNRQYFFADDLFKPKAFCAAKNALANSIMGCEIEAHRVDFDAVSADVLAAGIDVAFVGVDNDQARAFASRHFRQKKIPIIFSAVNENADYGWVFVQSANAGDACLGCVFPDRMQAAEEQARICTSSPATIDILQAVGSLTLYAFEVLLKNRRSKWTFRDFHLVSGDSISGITPVHPNCPLCGAGSRV